jgi:hypothetical protein
VIGLRLARALVALVALFLLASMLVTFLPTPRG